ncbi:FAD-binding and (Fe-S)-binding domain-containing protein [Sinosporangium siamense]|uniref:Lactate dehydrogenase n=1 Tax=Sinosporangium siamense TaxID=1367973 RepID=A0A919RMG6_9ACTN|nr:FAD-binding and (Fe-S)-binding domain-containing protein [Sinosporangium siamense]GII95129.1 lactate dehydrogenase [Sinosporangium siamense]
MGTVAALLRERLGVASLVRDGEAVRAAYSSDASIYRMPPLAVVTPRDGADVERVLEVARETGTPVTARGGGTSVAGNAISSGIVLDFSARMNRILRIDPEAKTAVVEPGVVLDDLRDAAAPYGLTLGPDPSTHSRCTLGGMIGNNACGSHSVAWGTTADNVVSLTQVRADGGTHTATAGTSGDLALDETLRRWRGPHLAAVRTELNRFSRQVSGYGLHHLLPENGFDVAKALVGSEGTCGILTEATVRLVPAPRSRVLLVLGFPDVFAAAAAAPELARSRALTVEGMGTDLLAALRARGGKVPDLPAGDAWLYCEFGADEPGAAVEAARLVAAGVSASAELVEDPARARALWRIRESAAGIATRMADGGEAWPGWEDSAVPPDRLAGYLRDLYALLAEHGLRGVPFGHFGEGCLHLRCDFELGSERGLAAYRAFITDAASLVAAHGGSVSGEHGDGRARSELLGAMYSPAMLTAFAGFKSVFDPDGLLNPGVLVSPDPIDAAVRPGPGRAAFELRPVHAFHSDGGSFATAVDRCVGVGLCRTENSGSMCPSFKATRDEVHSTRGRARVLSELLRGATVTGGYRSEEVRDALDLCLSCKACASECPVGVDMATYKAEFLHHHYAGRLRPAAHYTMGWLPVVSRLVTAARPLSRLVNAALARPRVAAAVKRAGGVEPRRDLIRFADRSLRSSVRLRDKAGRAPGDERPGVVLWPDTFTNYLQPEIGRDAVVVLEALGYRVEMPRGPVCCGLTWHSTGQLGVARKALRRGLDALEEQLGEGMRVVGLEPSCTVMLRDEARELLPGDARAELLGSRVDTFAEAVARAGTWPFRRLEASAVAQVHCHQEAKGSYSADQEVLRRLGVAVDAVGSGCCGLAGNFGFEPGHYEVSQACAERELYPKVRASGEDDLVLADGFSCRTQVAHGTDRTAAHLAQILRSALH